MTVKISEEALLKEIYKIHSPKYFKYYDLSKGKNTKIEIKCCKHNYLFTTTITQHVKSETGACPLCILEKRKESGKRLKNTIDKKTGLTLSKLRSKKAKKTMQKIDPETGISVYSSRGLKTSVIRKNTFDDNGLSSYQIGGRKAAETKQNIIDPKTGLNMMQINSKKGYEKSKNILDNGGLNAYQRGSRIGLSLKLKNIDEYGLNGCQRASIKGAKTRATTIDPITDLSIAATIGIKTRETKLKNIDKDGLNGFDRAALKAGCGGIKFYKTTKITYQSSNELQFLNELEEKHGFQWLIKNVKNGPVIPYINPSNNTERRYLSDFIIGNTVYEIKSTYTWFQYRGKALKESNIAKLNSTLKEGFDVKLIIDNIEMNWPVSIL